jgi:hypothetical protein
MRGLPVEQAHRLVNWGYLICDAALRSYAPGPDIDDPKLPFAEGI